MKDSPLQPTDDGRVRCSAWLGGVERLQESWAERAAWLESISEHSPGLFGDGQRMQARMFRQCIKELGALVLEHKDHCPQEYHGSETHQKLAAQNEDMSGGANYCEAK